MLGCLRTATFHRYREIQFSGGRSILAVTLSPVARRRSECLSERTLSHCRAASCQAVSAFWRQSTVRGDRRPHPLAADQGPSRSVYCLLRLHYHPSASVELAHLTSSSRPLPNRASDGLHATATRLCFCREQLMITSVEKIPCVSLRRSLISVICRKPVSGAFSRRTQRSYRSGSSPAGHSPRSPRHRSGPGGSDSRPDARPPTGSSSPASRG